MKSQRTVWCTLGNFVPLHYAFVPNEAAWHREMKRLGLHDPYPRDMATTTTYTSDSISAQNICLVTVGEEGCRGAADIEVFAILTHEATHVWQRLVEISGEKVPGAEQEAYAIQNITYELTKAFVSTRPYPKRWRTK